MEMLFSIPDDPLNMSANQDAAQAQAENATQPMVDVQGQGETMQSTTTISIEVILQQQRDVIAANEKAAQAMLAMETLKNKVLEDENQRRKLKEERLKKKLEKAKKIQQASNPSSQAISVQEDNNLQLGLTMRKRAVQ
jgi:hypothetical protein